MQINGHNIYLELNGPTDGPVVILLHHGLGAVRAWSWQVPALVDAGYRVLAYDRFGYGRSDPRNDLDLPTFTTDLDDLFSLMDQLGIQQAALMGHSDGGTIALYFAIQQPQRVSCIITVAAHIYVEPKMEPGIQEVRRAFECDERFRKALQSVHGEKYDAVFHNWFVGWHRMNPSGWDMRLILGKVSCPALIVQGVDDEHATPQHAMDIARSINNAELWLLPGAKHMLPQENYAEFNPKIIDFLRAYSQLSFKGGRENAAGATLCLAKS
ncbi:MAG TPA: alpha/beta hydrolase [Anaerolineales bacterium]